MSNKSKIAILVEHSKDSGLGHLKRSMVLKNYFDKEKKIQTYLILNKNKKNDVIKKTIKNCITSNFIGKKIYTFLTLKKINLLITDVQSLKNIKKNFLLNINNFLKKKGIGIINFGDCYVKAFGDVVILPYGVGSKFKITKKSYKTKIIKSANYFPLTSVARKKENLKIKNILIAISSLTYKAKSNQLIKILKKINPNFAIRILKLNKNYENNFTKTMKETEKQLNWSDFVICGAGSIRLEVINFKKPFIIYQNVHRKKDKQLYLNWKYKDIASQIFKHDKQKTIYIKLMKSLSEKKIFSIKKKLKKIDFSDNLKLLEKLILNYQKKFSKKI